MTKRIGLGQTITILANLAAVAGIVFVGLELRQNTQAMQVASAQSYLSGGSELDLRVAQDGDLAALLIRSESAEPLSPEEELQLERFNYATLRQWETAYYLYSIDAMEESLWFAYREEIRKIFLRSGRMQEFWRANKKSYTPAFNAVLEGMLGE